MFALECGIPLQVLENIWAAKMWLYRNTNVIQGYYLKPSFLDAEKEEQRRIGALSTKAYSIEILTKEECEDLNSKIAYSFSNKKDFVLFNKSMLELGILVSSKTIENEELEI